MKRIMLTAAALLFAAGAALAAEYDLAAYLAKVERDNPDLALARNQLAAAAETKAQARSALLPTVAASGAYTRNLKDIMQPAPVASLPGGGPLVYREVDSNLDNELTLALAVNQKLFDAESIARYAQAAKALDIQRNASTATRRGILNAAKKLYAQTQLADALVDVMVASEKAAEENYVNVDKKFRAGLTTELEALLAETAWKSKIPATLEAKKNAAIARAGLKNLAGIPLAEEVVLTEDLETLPSQPADKGLEAILASRPDFAANLIAKEIADIARKAALASYLPTVSGSFTYARGGLGDGGSLNDASYTASQLGLTVTVPLFTGGYRLSLVKSARLAQSDADLRIAKKRADIELELTRVRLSLDESRRRIDSARLAETSAQRAFLLARTALANGLATQLSVSEAASNLDQARLGLFNAMYEYRAACYDWDLAAGTEE